MLSISHHPTFIPHHPLPKAHVAGRIHSTKVSQTVDGSGARYVVFTQGCPLRCLYCHNPDCREICDGHITTVDNLLKDIQRYQADLQAPGGGVVVTGGEPLFQPEFVADLLWNCQKLEIPTILDTSGYANSHSAKHVVQYTDLVLLDIKSFDPQLYTHLTSVSLEPTLQLAQYLNNIGKPTWIRFILIPGLTDPKENVDNLASFLAPLENVERVEVIPFHQMGTAKWEALGYDYTLKHIPPPSDELVERVCSQFRQRGLTVVKAMADVTAEVMAQSLTGIMA
ncbi:MAG: pyruvate formate-lyase-activating protein [Leptolyngbyaceae bacterium]|nr:pyruvate formate-lyase-activating protein [Leptolyngbyaceae bacterium]